MNQLTNAGYAYMEPETLGIINDALMDRLAGSEGRWKEAPIYYDGISTQACDCGGRVSLIVHSLEFLDDGCVRGGLCLGVSRIEDEAPATWLPSGFANSPP